MVASEVTSWVPWIVEIPSVSHDLVHVDSHAISALEVWICYCHSSNSRRSKHYERDLFHEESRYFLCDLNHRHHERISKIRLFSVQNWHVLCLCVFMYVLKENVIKRKRTYRLWRSSKLFDRKDLEVGLDANTPFTTFRASRSTNVCIHLHHLDEDSWQYFYDSTPVWREISAWVWVPNLVFWVF